MGVTFRAYATLALAISVALSSIGHAQARSQSHGATTLVICSGYGLVRITIDANGNPVEHSLPCPDCVVSMGALLPDAQGLSVFFTPVQTTPPSIRALWSGASAGFWHNSRAPPALV